MPSERNGSRRMKKNLDSSRREAHRILKQLASAAEELQTTEPVPRRLPETTINKSTSQDHPEAKAKPADQEARPRIKLAAASSNIRSSCKAAINTRTVSRRFPRMVLTITTSRLPEAFPPACRQRAGVDQASAAQVIRNRVTPIHFCKIAGIPRQTTRRAPRIPAAP